MDKKIHKNLNVIECCCVLIGIICIICAAMIHFGETTSTIYNTFLFIVGIIAEVIVVSIELFFLHLETIKYKLISIGYFIAELVAIMFMNAAIPFAGLLVLTLFSIMKNIYRVSNVELIYKRLGYYELCKKFGIKVNRPRKARTAAVKKSVTPVRSTKRSTAKTREPNYA